VVVITLLTLHACVICGLAIKRGQVANKVSTCETK
jgi:hypothetical protein